MTAPRTGPNRLQEHNDDRTRERGERGSGLIEAREADGRSLAPDRAQEAAR